MTAPLPKIRTVLVVSEKGSRLSLPSTERAPFTVTETSNATGCCFAESLEETGADPGRAADSGGIVMVSWSFVMGGMRRTLAKKDFYPTLPMQGSPQNVYLYMFSSAERANYSTRVLRER